MKTTVIDMMYTKIFIHFFNLIHACQLGWYSITVKVKVEAPHTPSLFSPSLSRCIPEKVGREICFFIIVATMKFFATETQS